MRVPLLVSLQRVDCASNVDNLTKLIVEVVSTGGGLDLQMFAKN